MITGASTFSVTNPCVVALETTWLRLPGSAFVSPVPHAVPGATSLMCGHVIGVSINESKVKLNVQVEAAVR